MLKKEERRNILSIKETLEKEPLLHQNILKGGGMYVEYRSDDADCVLKC